MCALHDLRAQTHLGLSAARWSGWFPPGDPPITGAADPVAGVIAAEVPDDAGDRQPAEVAHCDCLAGQLHAL